MARGVKWGEMGQTPLLSQFRGQPAHTPERFGDAIRSTLDYVLDDRNRVPYPAGLIVARFRKKAVAIATGTDRCPSSIPSILRPRSEIIEAIPEETQRAK